MKRYCSTFILFVIWLVELHLPGQIFYLKRDGASFVMTAEKADATQYETWDAAKVDRFKFLQRGLPVFINLKDR